MRTFITYNSTQVPASQIHQTTGSIIVIVGSPSFLGDSGEIMDKRTLLVATPFCSPNYAYPAAAYLARYLNRNGRLVAQADLSLQTLLGLFSRQGLERVFRAVEPAKDRLSAPSRRMVDLKQRYLSTVDTVIGYLQGRDPSMAYRLCHRDFLPRGWNFDMNRGFDLYDGTGNTIPIYDRAKFIGTQYLYDLAGLVRDGVFPYFQITMVDRHKDDYVHGRPTFDKMYAELLRPANVVDQILIEALDQHLDSFKPDVVGVSVPFARNLYWALRIAKRVKERCPGSVTVAGGGLFNTSMRSPREPRLFDFIDYFTLDDGERPLLNILEWLEGKRGIGQLKRTFYRAQGLDGASIQYSDGSADSDLSHEESGAPDFTGYAVSQYYGTLENVNISQRVHSDGWWNHLTMAHGCYWKKCSFCDIHLSYIADYQTASAENLVDKVEEAIAQTGRTGFHFVDEALPPKVMRAFALELLRRRLHITWYGMLRFDKTFTPELCRLLAASGLIVAFGGLEVASNRLLQLMEKGTSVEQVAVVCKNFQEAGIRVHAYIMYGFPTQTAQETIDAMDVVRQLFLHGLITSASWSKFEVTPHSPVGRDPAKYGIEINPMSGNAFLDQLLGHKDPANNHDWFTAGLQASLVYYGVGLHHQTPSEKWFNFNVPSVSIDRNVIASVLEARERTLASAAAIAPQSDRRAIWLGTLPSLRPRPVQDGREPEAELVLDGPRGEQVLPMPARRASWLASVLERAHPSVDGPIPLGDIEQSFSQHTGASLPAPIRKNAADLVTLQPSGNGAASRTSPEFEALLASPEWRAICACGLTLV